MTGYRAFTDPAGGTVGGDSFALAIAHCDNEIAVHDLLFERPGPFSPPAVVGEIVAILHEYGITTVVGDKYAASWVRQAFADLGVTYVQSQRDRSQIYAEFLPLATAGRVRLLDHAKLISQLSSLERIAGAGRDRIDHPRGQHDDLANVTCAALVLAAERDPSEDEIVPIFIASDPVFDRWQPRWVDTMPTPMPGSGYDYEQDRHTGTLQWDREQRARRGGN
jgi:hypothetical protein